MAPPLAHAPAASRELSSLLSALKLPGGRLSASLVTVARFFSLPLDSTLLAAIRRQALAAAAADLPPPAQQKPGAGGRLKPSIEAFTLAAAAAADKDAPLNAAALAEYAHAIDPDSRGGNQNSSGTGGQEPDNKRRNQRQHNPDTLTTPQLLTPSLLREKLLDTTPHNSTLAAFNTLPGRNGQRWLVFPFTVTQGKADYRISLRILLNSPAVESRSALICLDLTEPSLGTRRLVVVDAANGKPVRARLIVRPAVPAHRLKSLSKALAALLGLPPERVTAEHCGALFPLVPDSGEPPPESFDQTV
jgi:hypothetical protein